MIVPPSQQGWQNCKPTRPPLITVKRLRYWSSQKGAVAPPLIQLSLCCSVTISELYRHESIKAITKMAAMFSTLHTADLAHIKVIPQLSSEASLFPVRQRKARSGCLVWGRREVFNKKYIRGYYIWLYLGKISAPPFFWVTIGYNLKLDIPYAIQYQTK